MIAHKKIMNDNKLIIIINFNKYINLYRTYIIWFT